MGRANAISIMEHQLESQVKAEKISFETEIHRCNCEIEEREELLEQLAIRI